MSTPQPTERFTPEEVSRMAQMLLQLGLTPRAVRLRLQEKGVSWRYAYGRHNGIRERLRRLRQRGQGLCSECHKNPYPLGASINVCSDCLDRKWNTGQ